MGWKQKSPSILNPGNFLVYWDAENVTLDSGVVTAVTNQGTNGATIATTPGRADYGHYPTGGANDYPYLENIDLNAGLTISDAGLNGLENFVIHLVCRYDFYGTKLIFSSNEFDLNLIINNRNLAGYWEGESLWGQFAGITEDVWNVVTFYRVGAGNPSWILNGNFHNVEANPSSPLDNFTSLEHRHDTTVGLMMCAISNNPTNAAVEHEEIRNKYLI